MTWAERTLTDGETRRLALLDSAFPVLFIETTPGAGARGLVERWAAVSDGLELRVALHADKFDARGTDLLRAVIHEVRAAQRAVGVIVDDDEPADEPTDPAKTLLALLRRAHRQVVVAVTRANYLDPGAFAELLRLLSARDRARIVASGLDASELMRVTRRSEVPYARIDDGDLALDRDEVRAMLQRAGLDAATPTVTTILRRTRGLRGVVRHVIDRAVDGSVDGTVDDAQPLSAHPVLADPGVLGEYLVSRDIGTWPSPLVRFAAAMAQVPRFTVLQAGTIAQVADARVLIGRLVALQLGEMTFDPGLRQSMFRWFEPARIAVRRYMPVPDDDGELWRRAADAARAAFDGQLLVVAYVSLDQLADAEEHLTSWLWDVVPNSPSPLWEPLRAVGLAELADYPYLTYLRVRVDPRGPHTPAGEKAAAAVADALAAREASSADPWQRLGDLAVQADLARVRGDLPGMTQPVARARALAADLLGGTFVGAAGRQGVSSVLLLAEAVFRASGIATAAEEFAGYALDLLDVSRGWLDPHEHARGFAARLLLVAAREAGRADPVDAAQTEAGPQFRSRDADIAAQGLATMWRRVDSAGRGVGTAPDEDAGDGAVRACSDALARVADASQWPGLWYPQVALAYYGRRGTELRVAIEQYRHACATIGLDPSAGDDGVVPAVLPVIQDALGQAVLPPSAGPVLLPGTGLGEQPRWRYHHEVLSALAAVRDSRASLARRHLERAGEIAARRQMSPRMLSVAGVEEIDELQRIIDDYPLADVLRLDEARDIATVGTGETVAVSGREQEVLTLLRRGMTNKQISEELVVSVNTVKFHRGNLMRKVGASSRQQLLEAAARLGL